MSDVALGNPNYIARIPAICEENSDLRALSIIESLLYEG